MTPPSNPTIGQRTAVIGGGLSGLAAAVALQRVGFAVELFEAGRGLGGRARSFREPNTGRMIDNCQHVSMGCCTALLDFCKRTHIDHLFDTHKQLHFFGPNNTHSNFAGRRWLPAPLHLLPDLMRLPYLSLKERCGIVRAMVRLARQKNLTPNNDMPVETWLRRQGQSDRAIDRFWSVVLVSALGETLERASLSAARKVFVDGFMSSRNAYELRIPSVPLIDVFDRPLRTWLSDHETIVRLNTRVKRLEGDAQKVRSLVLDDGQKLKFDNFVVAVPWQQVQSLVPQTMLNLTNVDRIESAPITAIHMWLDRPITPLPHAVLVGRLGQWLFNHETWNESYYCQVVISASHDQVNCNHSELVERIHTELKETWPNSRDSKLLHWRVVTEPRALFSVCVGIDQYRPSQQTPIDNLALAGDWTKTGWPATMEGAVRSGFLAAEAIVKR